jgi:phage-related protein
MNIISDTSSSGSGITNPSFDLSKIEDMKVPSWIEWIADNKDIVIGTIIGIATAIGMIKFVDLIGGLDAIWNLLKPIFTFIGKNAVIIGGIIAIIGGLAIAIDGIIKYFKDPTWENFIKILIGIGVAAAGVFLIFGGIPALITLIVGAVIALGVAIYKNWDKIVEFTEKLVEKIKDAFGVAIDWVKERFNSMVSFFSGLISKIVGLFKTIGTKVGDAIGGAFKAVINGILKAIETILNKPINAINSLLDVINAVPGINLGKLNTFNLPRLAVGGIVNMPSRGVPIGGAIAGEAGAEGVIPLTNSQAMETLGQAIGKYVTINANITNTMNGRIISRELQKVNSSSDFAFNR